MTTILMYDIVSIPMVEWLTRNPDGITVDVRKSEPIQVETHAGRVYIRGATAPSFIRFKNDSTALMFQLTFPEHLIGQQYDYEEEIY